MIAIGAIILSSGLYLDPQEYPKLPNDVVCGPYGCYKQSYVDNGYRYQAPIYWSEVGPVYIGNNPAERYNFRRYMGYDTYRPHYRLERRK